MGICVLDYGMGNLRSIRNAFDAIGEVVDVVDRPEQLDGASGIVVPGVGAFGDAMRNLRERGFIEALERRVRVAGVPFLGLCLGMQLVATGSTEHGESTGLDWIPGRVERIESKGTSVRVPHIGWNDVSFSSGSRLFAGLGQSQVFYFVHSYVFRPDDVSVIAGTCEYSGPFAAGIENGNIFGTQFHPEKSQSAGLTILGNFARLCSSTA